MAKDTRKALLIEKVNKINVIETLKFYIMIIKNM